MRSVANRKSTVPHHRHRFRLLGGLLAALAFLCPASLQAATDGNLPPETFMMALMEQQGKAEFVLLDVRTPGEYRKGHIQGAKLLDYYHRDFARRLKALDRDRTYLLYCRSGNRSGRTLALMEKLGFRQVAHLAGGIVAWQRKGYRLIQTKGPDTAPPAP